jgi:hypothetical protein
MSIHVYAGTSIISARIPRVAHLESIDDIRFASLCNANGIAGVESPSENGRDIVAIAACMLDDEIVASSCRCKKIVTVSLPRGSLLHRLIPCLSIVTTQHVDG